jgi:hypothetical protein
MVQELVHTFEATVKFIEQSVADLSDLQMIEQPPGVPNHGTWTLGHIIYSCQGMAIELGANQWLPDDWESFFGYGSMPHSDLQRYPKKSELLKILADAKGRLSQTLLTVNESVLGRSLPDEMLPTMGHLLLQVVVAHTAYHVGQLAVWRRAIGKESVGVFI